MLLDCNFLEQFDIRYGACSVLYIPSKCFSFVLFDLNVLHCSESNNICDSVVILFDLTHRLERSSTVELMPPVSIYHTENLVILSTW
jgi:hypothetical protein